MPFLLFELSQCVATFCFLSIFVEKKATTCVCVRVIKMPDYGEYRFGRVYLKLRSNVWLKSSIRRFNLKKTRSWKKKKAQQMTTTTRRRDDACVWVDETKVNKFYWYLHIWNIYIFFYIFKMQQSLLVCPSKIYRNSNGDGRQQWQPI